MTESIKILVVDDNPQIRDTLQRYLEKQGHMVNSAVDGTDAWELIQTFQPSMVISDLNMPRGGGLDLLKKIRKAKLDIYVILISGVGEDKDIIEALRLGANNFYKKPFNYESLSKWIKEQDLVFPQKEAQAPLTYTEYEQCLTVPSRLLKMNALVTILTNPLIGYIDKIDWFNIKVALEEIIMNSWEHGNLGIGWSEKKEALSLGKYRELIQSKLEDYGQRSITIKQTISNGLFQVVILDEGEGFRYSDWEADKEIFLARHSGRGLLLADSFFDSIEFSQEGRQIDLIKAFIQS